MTAGPADRARVRRSARQVGVWTGLLSALVLAAGVGVLSAVILATARVDHDDSGGRGVRLDHLVVDVDRVLPWLLALGAVGVVMLGLIAWLAARRAVGPLAQALAAQRNFVADASHELRTPLTALSTRVQVLQRRHARGEAVDDLVEGLRGDAAMMQSVLSELLQAAEAADPGRGASSSVGECVEAAAATVRPLGEAAGVAVECTCPEGLRAAIPAVSLTRACVALADNAVKHSPRGATVRLEASQSGRWAQVRVSDSGGGIAEAELPRLFDRFSRGPDRPGRRAGFGLGLALVRDTAARYGGSVEVEETGPAGSVFRLRLRAVTRPRRPKG